jgi:hypothetical protein
MGGQGFDFADSKAVLVDMLAYIKRMKIEILPHTATTKTSVVQSSSKASIPSLFQFGSGTRTSKVSDLRYLGREIQADNRLP